MTYAQTTALNFDVAIDVKTLTEYQRNILSVWYRSNDLDRQQGMDWYYNANVIASKLASRYRTTTSVVCGVIAALSPGCTWERNIEYAERALINHSMGMTANDSLNIGSYGKANMRKAWRIMNGDDALDVLGGNKVRAFYTLLNDPLNSTVCCIDRHAVGIAVGKPVGDKFSKYTSTDKKYNALANEYARIALELGIMPHQLQAVTWVTWRRINNEVVDNFM